MLNVLNMSSRDEEEKVEVGKRDYQLLIRRREKRWRRNYRILLRGGRGVRVKRREIGYPSFVGFFSLSSFLSLVEEKEELEGEGEEEEEMDAVVGGISSNSN
jgi:hypothetical protein